MFLIIFGFAHSAITGLFYLLIINYTNGSYATILSQLIPLLSSVFSFMCSIESKPSKNNISSIIKIFGTIFGVFFAFLVCYIELSNKIVYNQQIKDWIIGIFY